MATKTTSDILVHYKYGNGAWERTPVTLNLKEFIEAKSQDVYIREIIKNSNLGPNDDTLSIEYNFSKEMAEKLLDS